MAACPSGALIFGDLDDPDSAVSKRMAQAEALSPAFNGLNWVAANELSLQSDGSEFTAFEGSYDYWLPNFDISMDITDSLVARASVSRTLPASWMSAATASSGRPAGGRAWKTVLGSRVR